MAATEQELEQFAQIAAQLGSTQIGAVLERWPVSEKIDAGKAVEGLEEHPGFKVLERVLREARESALVSLVHAPRATENAAALQKQLGVVRGLEAFRVAVPTILEKAKLAQAERDRAVEQADAERQEA